MDPRFSYANSYPDPIPQFFVVEGRQIPSLSWSYRNLHAKEFTVWENAINQSKGELAVYSIESIGAALNMLYGPFPVDFSAPWVPKIGRIDRGVVDALCDFTIRASLFSNEMTKTEYEQLLEWISVLTKQYKREVRPIEPKDFTYILARERGQTYRHFNIWFLAEYGPMDFDENGEWHPLKEVSYQDAFDVYRFWRIGTLRGELTGAAEDLTKRWAKLLAREVRLFPARLTCRNCGCIQFDVTYVFSGTLSEDPFEIVLDSSVDRTIERTSDSDDSNPAKRSRHVQ